VPVLRVGRVAQLAGTVALFKVASGLSERWITFDERAYAGHFDDMASMAEVVDLDDAARTHPLVPLRVKALLGFSQSTTFAGAFGKTAARISARELETSVATMLSVLDPDLSELEGAKEEDAFGRFLMDGALLVIGADGVVEPGEVAWLQSVTSPATPQDSGPVRASSPRRGSRASRLTANRRRIKTRSADAGRGR
jgi:hypothetical protein